MRDISRLSFDSKHKNIKIVVQCSSSRHLERAGIFQSVQVDVNLCRHNGIFRWGETEPF